MNIQWTPKLSHTFLKRLMSSDLDVLTSFRIALAVAENWQSIRVAFWSYLWLVSILMPLSPPIILKTSSYMNQRCFPEFSPDFEVPNYRTWWNWFFRNFIVTFLIFEFYMEHNESAYHISQFLNLFQSSIISSTLPNWLGKFNYEIYNKQFKTLCYSFSSLEKVQLTE